MIYGTSLVLSLFGCHRIALSQIAAAAIALDIMRVDMVAGFDVAAGRADAQAVLQHGIAGGDVHQGDLVPVGDVSLGDDFEVAALAVAADVVAGLDGFEDDGADVVGGVDDEYFFHLGPFLDGKLQALSLAGAGFTSRSSEQNNRFFEGV